MRIWPIVLDYQPAYVGERTLLSAPLGKTTLADYLSAGLHVVTSRPIRLVAPDGVDAGVIRHQAVNLASNPGNVYTPDGFSDLIRDLELSDALLLLEARAVPSDLQELIGLVAKSRAEPRLIHHLIEFERVVNQTTERVTLDPDGQVRTIQRHYERATWPRIATVSATVLPVACAALERDLILKSLPSLRLLMNSRGAPTRDIPLRAPVFDLSHEAGLIAANDRLLAGPDRRQREVDGTVLVGGGHRIHPTARIVGKVVFHPDVVVENDVTILGPTVVGSGACIRAGAVVGHTVIGAASEIPAAATVYGRAWFGTGEVTSTVTLADEPSYAERVERMSHDQPLNNAPWHQVSRYIAVKRVLDAALAAVSLVLVSPIMLIVAVLIALQRDGPVFYGDEREGMNGREFRCWKFRTMATRAHSVQADLHEADLVDGPHFKVARDPRVTRIGALLRVTNVDELPQLWNVLRGDMSFVGPRPSPFRENQICVPWREARISVRPGITGLWQICRHNRAAGDFHQWIEYDLLYVQHISFWTDVNIFAATVLTLGGKLTYFHPSTVLRNNVVDQTVAEDTAA